jgi:cell division protein ZapA
MNRAPVELRVAGHTYRVASTATEDELRRLARVIEDKLRALGASASFHPQSILLVAISLAHELEEERARRERSEERCREMLAQVLERVDAALELTDEPPPSVAPSPTT